MAVNSWARRQFNNGVITTATLSGSLGSGVTTTFSVGSGQGSSFPDGSVGPFIVTIALVNSALQYSNEERILCASRSGDVFTIAASGRGYNGYSALNHNGGESVLHTVDKQDFDEANQVANQTLGAVAAKGDLLVGSAANTLTKISIGTANQFPQVQSGTIGYVSFGSGGTTAIAASGSDGTSTNPARYDHTHSGVTTFNGSAGAITGVGSFNTRTGAVVPTVNDYLAMPAGGLTGATANTRYVGGTASGAPTSGTFNTGDFIVDRTGIIWVCTAFGTPGTWQPVNAPITANATVATQESTASTAYTDLTTSGPAVTITTGTAVKVTLYAALFNSTQADGASMSVAVSGASTVAASDIVALAGQATTLSNVNYSACSTFVLSGLTGGSNTFTAKYRAVTGGTASFTNRNIIVERLN